MTATETERPKLVVLSSGDRLEVRGETNDGVQTDAGTHPWDECECFLVWSEKHRRVFSIPLKD